MSESAILRLVTANRLRDGAVVYFDAAGHWSTAVDEAHLVPETAAEALLAQAQEGPKPLPVVAPYIAEAVAEHGKVCPVSLRERIRATGPTI